MATKNEQSIFINATRIKNSAESLRAEARSYDVRFPYAYADEITKLANDIINTIKKPKK